MTATKNGIRWLNCYLARRLTFGRADEKIGVVRGSLVGEGEEFFRVGWDEQFFGH